jgi:hypothetical protein
MTSTIQKDNNPLLTRWAALTTPPGALCAIEYFVGEVRFCSQFREG